MFNRNCQIQGHKKCKIIKFCITDLCKCAFRWVCEKSLKQNLHQHENNYLVKIEKLANYLNENQLPEFKVIKSQMDKIQKMKKELSHIDHIIGNMFLLAEIHQQYKQKKNISFISNQQLDHLLKIEKNCENYSRIKYNIESIAIQIQNFQFENFQYELVHYENQKIKEMEVPSISQNEKYLGFVTKDLRNLRINYLSTNKSLCNKKFLRRIRLIKFSSNSKFILVDDCMNQINYFSRNNSKLQFKMKISSSNELNKIYYWARDVIWINASQILIDYGDLIIIDLFKRKLLLKIEIQKSLISLEYDKVNRLIVTSTFNIINFYDVKTGRLQFQESCNKKDINNIQLLNDSKNLLLSHIDQISLWYIDHLQKKLTLIQSLDLEVFYCRSIYSGALLIIRNSKSLQIYDYNFQKIYELNINSSEYFFERKFNQYMSDDYIITQNQNGQSIIFKNKKQLGLNIDDISIHPEDHNFQ
ncbi:hypothetical protein pb186bvf_002650 [Paramecium bursaria]